MKDVVEYAKILRAIGNQPHELTELDRELTGNLIYLYEKEVKRVKLKKSNFWIETKDGGDKKLSDTMVDALWNITPEGKDEIRLKYTILSYEALLKSIKNSLISASVELKHLS